MGNKKQNKGVGRVDSCMPETMFSDVMADQARMAIDDAISDLHFAVLDLRSAGVPIETVKDLNSITREGIKEQLEKDKEAYFKNLRFVPAGLRRQVNKEFSEMEATLLPLANNLVNARKKVQIPYSLSIQETYKTGEYCIKCDKKDLEDYVNKAATIAILPEYREYYKYIEGLCESWKRLQEEAERLHIVKPNRNLILDLLVYDDFVRDEVTGENKPQTVNMRITPEKMFEFIHSNRIRIEYAEGSDE